MALNDVWRFSCVGSHAGTEIAVITLHLRETSGVAETATASAYIKNDLLTPFAAQQADTFRWDVINLLTVNTTPKRSEEYTVGFPISGALAGGFELPHQIALVTTIKTAYAGRSYRGRCYLPAMAEGNSTNGMFTTGATTPVNSAWTTFLSHVGSAGSDTNWRFVVWSSKLNTANNVTSVVVRSNPGVIRRRRVGVGQ